MDSLPGSDARCPHCRAAVRADAPWCSLCHADLRPPPPAPVLRVPPVAAYGAAALDPLTAPAAALGLPAPPPAPVGTDPTWPCATCGGTNPLAASTCRSCGAGFLAGLREAEGPLLELPGVGDLTRLRRGQRMALALAVVVAVVALTALLGLLSG